MKKLLTFIFVLLSFVSFAQTNSIYKGSASVNADSAVFRNIVSNLQGTYGDIGALYYNRESSKWRVFADSVWYDLVLTDSIGGGGMDSLYAYNGLTRVSNDSVKLGGALTENTTISGAFSLTHSNATLTTNPTTWNVQTAPTITAGQKFVFAPSATTAGLNSGSLAGNPSAPVNGDMWYNSTANRFLIRINGSSGTIPFLGSVVATRVPFLTGSSGELDSDAGFIYNTTNDVLTVGSLTALTTTTTPALNIGGFAGNPSSLSNGSIWQNSSTNSLNFRLNGATAQHFNNGFVSGSTTAFFRTSVGANESLDLGAGFFSIRASSNAFFAYDTGGEEFEFSYNDGDLFKLSHNTATNVNLDTNSGTDLTLNPGANLGIVSGSNKPMGTATLAGGTVTVNNTLVTNNSVIILTHQSLGTITRPVGVGISARVAGTSFTILSEDATDTSVIGWLIIEAK